MKFSSKLFFALSFLGVSLLAHAEVFKIATVAPEGTTLANNIKKMAAEVKEKTNGQVVFRIYAGGVQGDEADVLRKMQIGQLDGGIFAGRALGDLNGDIRIMEVPFSFLGKENKRSAVLKKLTPFFNEGIKNKKMTNLGFLDVGIVYIVSTAKIEKIDDFKRLKIWTWDGDDLATTFAQTMQVTPVPLSVPDVLSAFSTGMLNVAYATPSLIIALQWGPKVKYLLDFPLTFSMGGFIVRDSAWDKVPAATKKQVEEIVAKSFSVTNAMVEKENREALETLKKQGLYFTKLAAGEMSKSATIRSNLMKKIENKIISAKAIKLFNDALNK